MPVCAHRALGDGGLPASPPPGGPLGSLRGHSTITGLGVGPGMESACLSRPARHPPPSLKSVSLVCPGPCRRLGEKGVGLKTLESSLWVEFLSET